MQLHDMLRVLVKESGAGTFYAASYDVKLLCLQRFVRLFGYGLSYLILVHFLSSLGIPETRIGLFMTMTLLGDVVISFLLTLVTDRVGRRRVLLVGSGLMAMSGTVFAVSSNYWILLLASVLGVISPSGNEIGPFKAIEESILAQLTEKEERSDIFAWYMLFGTFGAALGTVTCGFLVQQLQNMPSWTLVTAYRTMFAAYATTGLIKLVLTLVLSQAIEAERIEQYQPVAMELEDEFSLSEDSDHEDEIAIRGSARQHSKPIAAPPKTRSSFDQIKGLLPHISPASRSIVARLVLLFVLDSFASGLASPSWLTYYFTTIHHLPSQALGTLFLVTNLIATVSNMLALPIARRLGPLKTMTFTHLPSAVFLGLVPIPPATTLGTWFAMGFLSLRACTQSMDQAPRQAFLSAMVLPAERTAVLGFVNIAKTLAQAGGIGCTGILASKKAWVIMFGGAGALKASYDLLMLWMFLGVKDRESDRGT